MSKRQADRLSRLRKEKRGVVLLVVVSILTLFLMIGVTYVLVAGNYNKASGQALRAKTYGDESEREIEEVLAQVLYGTPSFGGNGPRSVISPHSLLQDLYGNDIYYGWVSAINNYNAGQSLAIQFTTTLPAQPIPNYFAGRVLTFTDGPAAGLSTRVMAYYPAGVNNGGTPELMVETPESDLPIPVGPSLNCRFIINGAPFNGTGAGYTRWTPGPDMQWGNAGMDDDGDGVTDNRSEEGFAGSDDVLVNNLEEAVTLTFTGTPNRYASAYLPNYFNYPSNAPNPAVGGLDETWDVPDYQNMFLAMIPPQKTSQFDAYPLLPSFHRPDLVLYWRSILYGSLLSGVAPADQRNAFLNPYGYDGILGSSDDWPNLTPQQAQELAALKRMMVFRPLRQDHPNFTGGNTNFAEDNLAGPYDVDNDGDGITDSIWIDAGLPPVTAPNGRRYKRLVAILIKDLDGRVNPTVHGNTVINNDLTARPSGQMTDAVAGTNGNLPVYVSRGLGFGPAEVDFRHILNNVYPLPPIGDQNAYNAILQARYVGPTGGVGLPGFPNQDDGWSQLRTIGMPDVHTNTPQVVSAYATPPDVWGRAALAADYTGQPLWYLAGNGERMDDPYEVQWNSMRAGWDSPYTVAELEALLRYHDMGASVLPSRLMLAAGNYLATESRGTAGPSQSRREAFGMGSYIAAPKMIVPRELRQAYGGGISGSILDLYVAAILSGRGWSSTIGSNPADPNYTAYMNQLKAEIPFELLKGQLFNINRDLGNGKHDATGADPYGVVDDPSETTLPEQIITNTSPSSTANFDYFNDYDLTPSISSNSFGAPDPRLMMARHIYCLLMLLRNKNVNYDLNGDNMATPQETARHLAQWAVNFVDFRDADSIMTGFEYDADPFDNNGWAVDGNLQTNDTQGGVGGVVWGVERPELLITETIAGHDRRTTDEMDDQFNGMNNGKIAAPGEKDSQAGGANDFDQSLMPHGWAFLELYNPWYDRGVAATPNTANFYDHKAPELYSDATPPNPNGPGVDLSRVTPNGNNPVWRLLIVRQVAGRPPHYGDDPDYPQPEALTLGMGGNPPTPPVNYVDRTVYFANLAGGANRPVGANDGEVYFPSGTIPRAPVLPGRYAVIGSSGPILDAIPGVPYVTPIGRRTQAAVPPSAGGFDPAAQAYANTRRIVLNPNANPDLSNVQIFDNQASGSGDITTTDILPAVALPIDSVIRGGVAQAHSFNISELSDYSPFYGASVPTAATPNDEGHFVKPIDQPLDAQRTDDGAVFGTTDGTIPNYRTVHLQRLANPLLAWDPTTNPYITIDTSSFDVTSYNGVASGEPGITDGNQNLQTFQRGGRFYSVDAEAVSGYTHIQNRLFRDLWSREPRAIAIQNPTSDSPNEGATGPHYLPRALYHTLGYLNKRYHGSAMQPYFPAAAGPYRGTPYYQDTNGINAPPFPYLAFNNRPFTSPMEMLQVPSTSSSTLLDKFNFQATERGVTALDPTPVPQVWNNMYQPPSPVSDSFPYGHILNFFHTDPNLGNNAPEISRLFDFVETRTPYIDTEKYYNPAQFVSPNQAPAGFRPPFNYLSRFREPGRININTIFDEAVWNAAVRGFPGMCSFPAPPIGNEGDGGQFLTRLVLNRQGYGTTSTDILQVNSLYPSLFSNPFRTGDSADMMPPIPVGLRHPVPDGGLLRRDPLLASVPPPAPSPALSPLPTNPGLNELQPLFATENVIPYQDAARNPYFRFQPLQKVGNLFSTNSNCYAVWITVGYFEVEANDADNNANTPAQIDAAHPDGLRLAQEVGVDEGNVKRHRAFFIIDRSIPVGYEPGHRHNTDKAILLKRFIE